MKKGILILICMAIILSAMTACSDTTNTPQEKTTADINTQEENPTNLPFSVALLSEYRIIYQQQNTLTELDIVIHQLRMALKDRFGVLLTLAKDSASDHPYEILDGRRAQILEKRNFPHF